MGRRMWSAHGFSDLRIAKRPGKSKTLQLQTRREVTQEARPC